MNSPQISWKFFTIPNLLSILRILLIVPIVYCFLQEQRFYFYLGLGLIIIAIISDSLDGFLARKFNQISEIGKILDPLADKLAVFTLVVVLIIYKNFPLWAAVIIIGRDLLILFAGLIWATKFKFVTPSNRLGKWAAFIIAMMIVAYIIALPPLLLKIITYFAVLMTILSGAVYLKRFVTSLKSAKHNMS